MQEGDLQVIREQKRHLFILLDVEASNKHLEIKGLHNAILAAEAEMRPEDVSHVREKAMQLQNTN